MSSISSLCLLQAAKSPTRGLLVLTLANPMRELHRPPRRPPTPVAARARLRCSRSCHFSSGAGSGLLLEVLAADVLAQIASAMGAPGLFGAVELVPVVLDLPLCLQPGLQRIRPLREVSSGL